VANRYAVATGNWSATATWDGGTLPTSADDVYSNNFTVTIDQNVTVLTLRNTAATGITAGGGFAVSGGHTITCSNASGFVTGAVPLLTCTTASGTTTTINSVINGGTAANANGINFSGTGTLTISGNVFGGTTNQANAINVTSTGTLNVTGFVRTGLSSNQGVAIRTSSSGTLNVTGNVNNADGANAIICTNAGGGTVNITGTIGYNVNGPTGNNAVTVSINTHTLTVVGDVYGNGANAIGISSSGNANITVTGSVTGSSGGLSAGIVAGGTLSTQTITGTLTSLNGPALTTSGTATVTGPFIASNAGVMPATGKILLSPISNNEFRFKTASGTSSLFSSDVTSGAPTANNVRSGTVYGGGTLTGTLAVPSPSYVALGVATDNTVGSLAYNSDSAIADYLWNKQTSAITTAGSIGERLKNAATVDTVGSQIAAFDGL